MWLLLENSLKLKIRYDMADRPFRIRIKMKLIGKLIWHWLSREPQMKKTKVRPDYSSTPTQLALCLRFASMYKAESCYALQPSMTWLHNAELVNYECGCMNPLLCLRHHRQVKLAVKT